MTVVVVWEVLLRLFTSIILFSSKQVTIILFISSEMLGIVFIFKQVTGIQVIPSQVIRWGFIYV